MSAETMEWVAFGVFLAVYSALGAWAVGLIQVGHFGTLPWWERRFRLGVPAVLPDGSEGWWWLRVHPVTGLVEWTTLEEQAEWFPVWQWLSVRVRVRLHFGWAWSSQWVVWQHARLEGGTQDSEDGKPKATELDPGDEVWARLRKQVKARRWLAGQTAAIDTEKRGA